MLIAQSVLVTACLLAFHALLAPCSPLPAGSHPSSPSHSLSGSRSRSPEEHPPSPTRPRQQEGNPAPSLDFRLGLQGFHRNYQRSQSLRLQPFPSYSGTNAFNPQAGLSSQHGTRGGVRYHRSVSDPHHGLSSIKEDQDPSLDLGLSIGGSSTSSTHSNREESRKRVSPGKEDRQESKEESSKKHRLDHSSSMKESTSTMGQNFLGSSVHAISNLVSQASFSGASIGPVEAHPSTSAPAHQQHQIHDIIHQTLPPHDGRRAARTTTSTRAPPAQGRRGRNEPTDEEVDEFFALIRDMHTLRQHALNTGRPWPPVNPDTRHRDSPPRGNPPSRDSLRRGEQKRGFFDSASDGEGPDYAPAA